MDRSWKIDPRDNVMTIERDRDDVRFFEIDLTERQYTGTIGVTALAPVAEIAGSNLVISNVSADASKLTFRAAGAGACVTFRVTHGSGESEDLTFRFRSV